MGGMQMDDYDSDAPTSPSEDDPDTPKTPATPVFLDDPYTCKNFESSLITPYNRSTSMVGTFNRGSPPYVKSTGMKESASSNAILCTVDKSQNPPGVGEGFRVERSSKAPPVPPIKPFVPKIPENTTEYNMPSTRDKIDEESDDPDTMKRDIRLFCFVDMVYLW
jgi:hypothetical protein